MSGQPPFRIILEIKIEELKDEIQMSMGFLGEHIQDVLINLKNGDFPRSYGIMRGIDPAIALAKLELLVSLLEEYDDRSSL